jgi:SNF2 family DNA or RNA helicase
MEMGLGKTLTALTEFVQLVEKGEATRLVVVCPNSFKTGWRDEIVKQNINVDPWIYSSGADNDQFLRKKYTKPPVVIVNYEAIRRAGTQEFIYKFTSNRKCMVVFDESIQIKTHNSLQTKAAVLLSREFKYMRILSGKPMTQGPHDLWGQLRAIGKLNGMNYFAFRNLFCRMGGYMAKQVVGAQNEKLLAEMIDQHVFRATKDQWTDLPPKNYTMREFSMAPGQLEKYRTMEREFVAWLESGDNVTVDMAITKHIKLAQIQFGFLIDEDSKTHELVEPHANPRIQTIKDIIDDEVTGKVVVIYHHRYAGEVLLRELAKYRPAFIKGGMAPEEITEQRDMFNRDNLCRVICIQTTAGRYGHTLIGGNEPENHCSTMIFAENTWSLDTRSQLEDRIHRIGQRGDSCLYLDLVSSPLDRKIVRALQFKQSIFDAVMQHVGRSKAHHA